MRFLILTILAGLFTINVSAQIYSTSDGGYWDDTLTWVGHQIPQETDNVIIVGDVFAVGGYQCNNLTISNGVLFQNKSDSYPTALYVNGDIENNGHIQDNPDDNDYFILRVKGNITNNGQWENSFLTLEGSSDQTLITNTVLNVKTIDVSGTFTGRLVSGSDIFLESVNVDLDSADFVLVGNDNLYFSLKEGYGYTSKITDVNFIGNGNEFNMSGNQYIDYSTITDCVLAGRFLAGYDVHFKEGIVVGDTLMQFPNNNSTNAYFDENFVNDGVILDNPDDNDQLNLNVAKNLTNNGTLKTGLIKFIGTEDQVMSGSEPFSSFQITQTDTNSKIIIDGDVTFSGYYLSLGEGTLELNSGASLSLIPTETNTPRIEGGKFDGKGNNLIFEGMSFIDNLSISNTVLKGCANVGYDVYFKEGMVSSDTLQQNPGNYSTTLYVDDDFINNGIVRRNPDENDSFIIEIKKDLTNNGQWNPDYTEINGTEDQEIILRGNLYSGWGKITVHSNISGSTFQWKKDGVDMEDATEQNAVLDSLTIADRGVYTCVSNIETSRILTVTDSLSSNIFGNIAGRVTNAINGEGIEGAVVSAGDVTDITDADGNYTLLNVKGGNLSADFSSDVISGGAPLTVQFYDKSAEGDQTITANADNFIGYENRHVKILADGTINMDISLSPVLQEGEFRIVLNWGSVPSDLDSHLLTPEIEGTAYHLSYNAKGSNSAAPYATLDHDDTDGYGPETITINSLYSGNYKYYVHKYSSTGTFIESDAVVQVYNTTGLVRTINIPTSGEGSYWNVLEIDGNTGAVTLVNEITNDVPSEVSLAAGKKNVNLLRKSNEIISRYWDFGDGNSSEEINPEHMYSEPGNYTVSLIVSDGNYSDTLVAENYISVNTLIDVAGSELNLEYNLLQNYPNPFNPSTNIEYSVPEITNVKISVYDILGRLVKTLLNETKSAGRYNINFDAGNLSAGTYFYTIKAGNFSITRKMMLIK